MPIPLIHVDAFTDRPFAGNPAAVCLLPEAADAEWMQNVARDMNLSETAFVHPAADGYGLRWFTPGVEVDLCGHATLASAHVLWEQRRLPTEQTARFHTRSGMLTARQTAAGIEMDFPAKIAEPSAVPAGLEDALGAKPRWVGRNAFDYLVELESEAVVRGITPHFAQLARLPVRGVIVTAAASTAGYDFISRFFAPAAGVQEDPVTGSAHCCLGPFWHERLHKNPMTGYQASPRGGVVGVRIDGPRVFLTGHAVTVARGELVV
jgi:PhzF family phenazine biosynthesis protein